MAGPAKSRGNLALAFVGYFGVIASAVTGISRWFVIGFATFGFLSYVITSSNLHNYWKYKYQVRRQTTRWHTWIGHSVQVQPAGSGFFYARLFFGTRDNLRADELPEYVKEMMESKGFRCELRRPWHFTRYSCNVVGALRHSHYIEATLPEEFTVAGNGKINMIGGPFILRWKKDDQWRPIARCYIGFNEDGYQLHYLRRNYYRWLEWKNKIQNPEKWDELWT
jgi:hypothetical protein